jgi:hypothetical protein
MPNKTDFRQAVSGQLFSVISEYNGFDDTIHDDFSGGNTTEEEITQFNIRVVAAIERVVGRQNVYYEHATLALQSGPVSSGHVARELYGIISALYRDVAGGYLQTASELIHANLFIDFLDMGDYLLEEGYKAAAAVIIGGVLETHLRQLAIKSGIDTIYHQEGRPDAPKKAETLNQELGKSVYNLLQQKSITAWLDLRNNAAHAHHDKYDDNQVRQFSQGLKDFIAKYPA